jgi:hypothetical protein
MLASAGTRISVVTALSALTLLAGCDRTSPRAVARREARRAAANESAYHPAPAVASVSYVQGRVVLSGAAQPGVPVRLATPDGRVLTVIARRDGAWRIVLPPSPDMLLYSLSMVDAGRIVQSEGYLAVGPDVVAQLRAGAGAVTYDETTDSPRVTAIDYDSKGGCVVSGVAAPRGMAAIQVDGVARGGVRTNAEGRFFLALDEPVAMGSHTITLLAGGKRAAVTVDVTPAGPMPSIPLLAARTRSGWRVDWTTPGGGLQTTLLFASPGSLA